MLVELIKDPLDDQRDRQSLRGQDLALAAGRACGGGRGDIIAKAGKPKARLVPLADRAAPRQRGGWEGKVWVADDFDEPLPADILAAFEGKD